jgi:hypothetical protein
VDVVDVAPLVDEFALKGRRQRFKPQGLEQILVGLRQPRGVRPRGHQDLETPEVAFCSHAGSDDVDFLDDNGAEVRTGYLVKAVEH